MLAYHLLTSEIHQVGYTTISVFDDESVFYELQNQVFDLILLDIMVKPFDMLEL